MNHHTVGLHLLKDPIKCVNDLRQDFVQALVRSHYVEIKVRSDAKQVQNLIQHLAMLGRYANQRRYAIFSLKRLDDRCHLDGFRSGAEYR